MDYARLRSLFPPEEHPEIDARYRKFVARTDGPVDPGAFLEHLVLQGRMDGRTLREAMTLGEVRVAPLPARGRSFYDLQRRRLRYERVAPLGKGAMGEVHIAVDQDLQRTVAVKRILPEHVERAEVASRFYTEAQITAQLDHPNIVPIYSFEADAQGALSYGMKLVRGETLSEYLAETRAQLDRDGRTDEAHALPARLEHFIAVCAALGYAHSRGVIHRDLKPDNIMVGGFDEVLVMDWGLARPVGLDRTPPSLGAAAPGAASGRATKAGAKTRETLADSAAVPGDSRGYATQAGALVGTPQYMAPEQARGQNQDLGPWSDQYALGLILYEIVTLRPALRGESLMDLIVHAAQGELRPLTPYRRDRKIRRELAAIIAKATARDPAARYESVGALAADLRRYLQDEAVQAHPDGLLTRAMRWMSHHRALTLSIFFLLLLGGLSTAGVTYVRGRAALTRQREAALQRQTKLLDLAGLVSHRAHEVDTTFHRYEELLSGMAFAAQVALTTPAQPQDPYWVCARFSQPGGAPPDLGPSKVYGKPISVRELCEELAPGVDEAAVRPRLRQLSRLSYAFFRAKLESADEGALDLPRAKQEALLRDEGVPVAYTYMGIEEGVLATYPGRDTKRTDYDPRKRPWYAAAKEHRGPTWIATDSLSDLKGLLLTCAMAVRAPDDTLLGVASLDLEFVRLIERFLDQPDIHAPVETFFLTSQGDVILRSSLKEIAGQVQELTPDPFPFPALLPRFREASSGHALVDGRLVLWTRLETTRWTYVVVGDEQALIGAR